MKEKLSPRISSTQLIDFVRRINAGEKPDFTKYAAIPPYIDAVYDQLSAVKPQTESIKAYLLYLDSCRIADPFPRVHVGLLSIDQSIQLTFPYLKMTTRNRI